VPIFSVVSNALAVPVVGSLLGLGLAGAAVDPVSADVAAALGWINGWLAAYLALCARVVAAVPFAEIDSTRALALAVAVVAAIVVLGRLDPRRRLVAVALAAPLLAGGAAWRLTPTQPVPPTGLRLTFLDVGQGDAVLVQVAGGAILVDEGPPEGEAARQLRALGVRRLSLLVLTHPQRDHIGGAADVVRGLAVDGILDPRLPSPSPDHDEAIEAARARGVRITTARAGMSFRLGRLRARVLWPDGVGYPGQDPNERAVVLLLTYGSVDVLLTADAESGVTVPLRPPPVEILKVAHHGSADEGLPDLLRLTKPRVAVVSVGRGNDYGHPAPSTLGALSEADDLRVFRTDEDGRVTIESDGRRIEVHEER
jgi:competence protein ComEC